MIVSAARDAPLGPCRFGLTGAFLDALGFALAVAAIVFASGLAGLGLQRVLPERLTSGPARDMTGAVVGLLSLLSSLALGLLIWTAYGVHTGQNLAIQGLAARVMQLDLALADYGSGAEAGRALLRQYLGKTLVEVWGKGESDKAFAAGNFSEALASLRRRQAYLDALVPETDAQSAALASARATIEAIAQSRLQMSFALADPVSYPLIELVMTWAAGVFCGFGLMSRASRMAFAALACGAVAVASAAYLVVALSTPYSGVFRASPAPLQQALTYLETTQGTAGRRP